MFDYDKAGRYLIRLSPVGFFGWLSGEFVRIWQFRGWLDTIAIPFPGDRQRVCDTVAEFVNREDRRRRCLLDTEVQSRPHLDMPERLGEYAFQLRRERRHARGRHGKYQVIGAVLNLTGAVQPHLLDMTEAALNGAGLRIVVFQRTLREENAGETLQRVAIGELDRCVLPWIPLMRGGGEASIITELASAGFGGAKRSLARRLRQSCADSCGTCQAKTRVANRVGGLERERVQISRGLDEEGSDKRKAKCAPACVATPVAKSSAG
jgi:hypothetical protein